MTLLEYLGGYDQQNADAGQAAEDQLTQMAATGYAPGGSIYTAIQQSQGTAAANAATKTVASDFANQASVDPSTIDDAFYQSLKDSASAGGSGTGNLLAWLLGLIKDFFTNLFKQIPWWVWLLAALVLFWWLGGGKFLEKKARKALS